MKRHRKHPIDAELLAFWQARLTLPRQKLADAPEAPDAWFWKIQTEIIDYLLGRYCKKKTDSPAVVRVPIASPDLLRGLNPSPSELPASSSFPQTDDTGKMPRSSGKIAPILQNIAQANLPRHEQLQRLDAHAKEALRLEGEDLRARMARVRHLLDERGLLPEPEAELEPTPSFAMTDDQLEEELFRLISMDAPPPSANGEHTEATKP